MYQIQPEIRLQIVQHYLKNEDSLIQTAHKFNVHYRTVFKWVKLYKKDGKERLLSTYRRPWNRINKELEEKIALLKEGDPTLTVRRAKEIIEKQGIKISIKGIWGVWKRYGYAGFNKAKLSNDFTDYIELTKEAKSKLKISKQLFEASNVKKSAKILNSIPSLPKNELILKIPDNLLNLRRRVEKIFSLFGKVSLSSYLKNIRDLSKECKERNLYYSLFRLGIFEIIALTWGGEPKEQLKRTEELEKYLIKGKSYYSYHPFVLKFSLMITQGITYSRISKIEKAQKIARTCRKLLKKQKNIPPYFMIDLASLYSNLEDYKEAEYWLLRALEKVEDATRKKLKGKLSWIFLHRGEYNKAINLSRYSEFGEWIPDSWKNLFLSRLSLIKGKPQKSISLATHSLLQSKKEGLNTGIFTTSFTITSAYCSLLEKVKAKRILTSVLPFFVKKGIEKYVSIIKILLSKIEHTKSQIPFNEDMLPSVKLAILLNNRKYRQAFSYAKKKGDLTYFYSCLFFFPEAVTNLLRGKPTGLPKAILRLPIFNKEVPVYNIKFLGNLVVFKNQKYLKTKLSPKDTSFLIQLALKAGEPDKTISLDKLYYNFWRNSINPPRNLSHLLVRIKKTLKIPSHLLEISYREDNPVLINRGIHFITDYDEFKQSLAQAKALLRAGEWRFAKREFLKAFKLFRGEPFKKMYDDWSDDKRLEVLFIYEKEAKAFADDLIKRGRIEEAERMLKKAEGIVNGE